MILKSLEDEEITSLCKTNKYISGLCKILYKDEFFWENRLRNIAPKSLIGKPKNKTWHEYYIEFLKYNDDDLKMSLIHI